MTDIQPIKYWLPWWWDRPEIIPVTPLHALAKPTRGVGVPSATEVTPTPPTPPTFGFGGEGRPPPPASAAAVAVESKELKRLKERRRVLNR